MAFSSQKIVFSIELFNLVESCLDKIIDIEEIISLPEFPFDELKNNQFNDINIDQLYTLMLFYKRNAQINLNLYNSFNEYIDCKVSDYLQRDTSDDCPPDKSHLIVDICSYVECLFGVNVKEEKCKKDIDDKKTKTNKFINYRNDDGKGVCNDLFQYKFCLFCDSIFSKDSFFCVECGAYLPNSDEYSAILSHISSNTNNLSSKDTKIEIQSDSNRKINKSVTRVSPVLHHNRNKNENIEYDEMDVSDNIDHKDGVKSVFVKSPIKISIVREYIKGVPGITSCFDENEKKVNENQKNVAHESIKLIKKVSSMRDNSDRWKCDKCQHLNYVDDIQCVGCSAALIDSYEIIEMGMVTVKESTTKKSGKIIGTY